MEPLLGSIILFGGNFEPRGWAFCNGQSLQIAQYSALYSLLGTAYGGECPRPCRYRRGPLAAFPR